jgi:WLM domain
MSCLENDLKVPSLFPVHLCYQGKTVEIEVTIETTANELVTIALHEFLTQSDDPRNDISETQLKLLYKGKRLAVTSDGDSNSETVFVSPPTKTPKIMVLITEVAGIAALNSKRSDPTIRGFDQEKRSLPSKDKNDGSNHWGPILSKQDKNYKFCRFHACTWQSFGHRPGETTPHDFMARNLLMKLATDPGVVAVVKDRELVVGTLGEMDPIDDRLMQQKQRQGVCVLGYNTNGGTRIDIKLRTDDLQAFRPYHQLARTLIHELSHNWVGEHNFLFWTNYGQMMVEYCATHAFATAGIIVQGQTTAQIAGLPSSIRSSMDHVFEYVMDDLKSEMMMHNLDASMIETVIRKHCDELIEQRGYGAGHLLGSISEPISNPRNARDMALQAAERRQQEQKQQEKKKKSSEQ